MAGIGFKLRNLVEERGLLGFVAGYSMASAIMAGPWIVTILTVIGVTLLSINLAHFDAYITHVYQVSLITVGFIQFPATRYLADLLYRRDYSRVFPAFSYTTALALVATSAIGSLWAATTSGPSLFERVLVVTLMNIVTAQWVSLVFLVTVHAYRAILGSFVLGGVVSFFAVNHGLGSNDNLSILLGYSTGQLVTLVILVGVLMKEYPAYQLYDPEALTWVRRSPSLALAGGFFYLGIFADKFAYRYGGWLSDSSMVGREVLGPWLYISQPYEFLSFLAQLTVIPALAIFYVRVETGFYEVYKAFYRGIDERRTLEELRIIKNGILSEMKTGAKAVGASQAVISLLCFLVASELLPNRILAEQHTSLLRADIVASYFAILMLLVIVLLLYFEFYRDAFYISGGYAVLNFSLSCISVYTGDYHGWGAALASLIFCLIACRVVWVKVDDLLYQTFSKSPVETLPDRVVGIPGVGRYRVKKGDFSFDVEA